MNLPPQFFLTGTDTDVGKTVVACILARALKASYWKPIQCGVDPTDTERIGKWSDVETFPEGIVLKAPLSPHAAARLEEREVRPKNFSMPTDGPCVVEGCGGVLVPMNHRGEMLSDLIRRLGLPVVVVTRSIVGTINHTLMTLTTLRQRRIPILGVVMNGPKNPINKHAIEHFGGVQVLAEIEYFKLSSEGMNMAAAQLLEGNPCLV